MQRTTSNDPVDASLILHDVCGAFSISGSAIHNVADEITGSYLVAPSVNMAVGQIVTEAIMNALKHSCPEDQPGDVTVRSILVESGRLIIEVADLGVGGLPESFSTAAKSFGVRLMRGLARQENIGLSFVATSPGLSVQCLLPSVGGPHGNGAEA